MGETVVVVLAAGRGTRMKSDLPKVLHPVAGLPMIRHVHDALRAAGLTDIVVVIGEDGANIPAVLGEDCRHVVQPRPLGTGDAVRAAMPEVGDAARVLVVNGDAVLVTSDLFQDMLVPSGVGSEAAECGTWAATLVTAVLPDATGYGRVVRGSAGGVEAIVEEADASAKEKQIREMYSGIACFDAALLQSALQRLESGNAQGEFYITDVFAILRHDGYRLDAWQAPVAESVLGVNDRVELAQAGQILRRRRLDDLMRSGVTVVDPATTYVDSDVTVGRDTVLHPFTILSGATRVGARCSIGPGSELVAAQVHDGATVNRSVVERSEVGAGARVGPFSHIRPGSKIGEGAEVGNFAEIKATSLGHGAKAHHHSYLGDAELGDRVNVGAGVVTVNYDGQVKHRTIVKDDAFLGCNVNLVAPVEVGEGAYVAAGSTITDDVPEDALAIARERQTNKDGWAKRRRP